MITLSNFPTEFMWSFTSLKANQVVLTETWITYIVILGKKNFPLQPDHVTKAIQYEAHISTDPCTVVYFSSLLNIAFPLYLHLH